MSRSDMVRNGKTSQISLLSCLLPSFSYASPAIGRIIILSATSNLAHTFNLVMFWSSALSLALLKCMNVSNVRPILQLPFLVDLYQIMPKGRRSLQGDLNWLVTASIFHPKVCDRLHGAYNSHSVISVQLLTPFVVLRTDMYKSYAAASGLINWSLEGSLSIFAFALLSLPSVVLWVDYARA